MNKIKIASLIAVLALAIGVYKADAATYTFSVTVGGASSRDHSSCVSGGFCYFTAAQTMTAGSITEHIGNFNTPGGVWHMTIEDSGGTTQIAASDSHVVSAGSYNDVTFVFTTPFTFVGGTTYRVDYGGGSGNIITDSSPTLLTLVEPFADPTVTIVNPADNSTNISPTIPSWDVQYHINDGTSLILVNHPGLLTIRYATATSSLDIFGAYFQDNRYVYNDDTGSGFVPVTHSYALGVNTRVYARVTWYDSDYTTVLASSTIAFTTNNPATQNPGNYDFGFRFNSTSSDAAIFRSTSTQFRATSTYINDISAHCAQTGDFSVWNPQDWFCVVTDGISNMFQIMQDKVTVAYNRIILVFQSIFPLNVYADINNDLDAAQASSTVQTDIVLADTSHHIFGGHTFTILNSSTTAWVKDDAHFDYKKWFDYMLYGITGLLIIGTALMVIKSIHNSSVNQA